MRFGRVRWIHFVGIGGIGMSGIAEVLLQLGYRVSGSDLRSSPVTQRLASLGARVHEGHDAAHVGDADVVVVSSAVPADNPEVAEARRRRIPVIPRAEMLAELMRVKAGIAVAGSHGKTSTTSMLATVLARCGLDPTVIVGGRLETIGSNARLGQGDLLLAEADESDGSFLRLIPTIAVVTGIDREHIDHYGSEEALRDAFAAFCGRVPFHGAVVACVDDPGVRAILPRVDRRVLTCAVRSRADYEARDVEPAGFGIRFTLHRHGEAVGPVRLRIPGRHQVQNALLVLAVADELGLSLRVAAAALEEHPGVDRRLQRLGEARGILVLDDYGHHPREIELTLAALREAIGRRRLVVLFQPHRYTRLADLMERFSAAFDRADVVVLADVYPAGEEPIPGATAERLAEEIAARGHPDVTWAGDLDAAESRVLERLREGDVVLTLGAGSVGRSGRRILAALGGGEGPR